MAPQADGACAAAVPDDVLKLLRKAYGDGNVGRTGHELQGHVVETRSKVESSADSHKPAASLVYGELLPEGASAAFSRVLPEAAASAGGLLLELGCGTGLVAAQAFLQLPAVSRVVGVEISGARCAVAAAAAARLAEESPERFEVVLQDSLELGDDGSSFPSPPRCVCRVREAQTGRDYEVLWGDMTEVDGSVAEAASAVLLQVVLPDEVRARAHALMQRAPDGCRAFLLDDLSLYYCLDGPSIFHAADPVPGGDKYPTSWNAAGHRFFVFVADRARPPSITRESAWRLQEEEAAAGCEL